MYNLMRAELFKLRKSPVIKILLSITLLTAVIMAVIAYLIFNGKLDTSMSGIGFLVGDMNIISILGSVLASILICGDFESKVIFDAISSGYGRGTVILSKALTYFISIALLLLPYAVITGVALSTDAEFEFGAAGLGFANLLVTESGINLSGSRFLHLLLVMLVLMIVYMGQLSICLPLAFTFRKPILVVALFYGWSAFCGQLLVLSGRFKLLDNILAVTPYGGNYSRLTIDVKEMYLIRAIIVSVIFMVLMTALAYVIFRKKELK